MSLALAIAGLVLASAAGLLAVYAVWKARRTKRRHEPGEGHGTLPRGKSTPEKGDDSGDAAEQGGRQNTNEEARRAVETEGRRAAEEARLAEEEARRMAAEEERRTAETEAQRAADEARLAEEEAGRKTAEEARRTAETEAQRAADEARLAGEEEARRKTEEECLKEAGMAAKEDTRRRAEEEERTAAEEDARREEDASRKAEEEEPPGGEEEHPAAEEEAQRAEDGARKVEEGAAAPIEHATQPRLPRKYRPVARVPGTPRADSSAPEDRETQTLDRALPISVRLVFEKAGFCRVSLLPSRRSGMPAEIEVSGSGDPAELLALQDEWYQDIVLPNAGSLLKEGIEWAGSLPEGRPVRWSLSGRELYVLTEHDELNGFVSTPRLLIGEQHVVLCLAEQLPVVRNAIELAGSPDPALLDGESGIPAGWVGLRGVIPRTPIAPSQEGDIFDALRPLAEVAIMLDGGIRLERQTWLNGYPPRIRLTGDTGTITAVTIDGHEATSSLDGVYSVPGWDAPGEHLVWCTSDSRSYAIREGAEDWEPWDAYRWSLGEQASQSGQRPAICGVVVRAPREAGIGGRAIAVPSSNPILLGATPGEIEYCTARGDVRSGLSVGFPKFEPIWAIPTDPLRCDKRSARVLLVGAPRSVNAGDYLPGRGSGVYSWCVAIRTARRKGLQTEPQQSEVADLWHSYGRHAKSIWRSLR